MPRRGRARATCWRGYGQPEKGISARTRAGDVRKRSRRRDCGTGFAVRGASAGRASAARLAQTFPGRRTGIFQTTEKGREGTVFEKIVLLSPLFCAGHAVPGGRCGRALRPLLRTTPFRRRHLRRARRRSRSRRRCVRWGLRARRRRCLRGSCRKFPCSGPWPPQ